MSVFVCSEKPPMIAPRVLYAEDETQIREIVTEILREEGYDILEARDGDEAASILDAEHVDVLVTDVRMPGSRDGLDLAAYARKIYPTIPVVVVTGFAEQVVSRMRTLGDRVTLVRKPFRLTELLCAVAASIKKA